jgi:hypothetical protein
MPFDNVPNVLEDETDADHCCCGIELLEEEATLDIELPPATGGVEAVHAEPHDDEDHEEMTCCDIDFSAEDLTTDEELPVSVGGM